MTPQQINGYNLKDDTQSIRENMDRIDQAIERKDWHMASYWAGTTWAATTRIAQMANLKQKQEQEEENQC